MGRELTINTVVLIVLFVLVLIVFVYLMVFVKQGSESGIESIADGIKKLLGG